MSAYNDPVSQGVAMAIVIGQYNMRKTYVFIQDVFLGGGFMEGIRLESINTVAMLQKILIHISFTFANY